MNKQNIVLVTFYDLDSFAVNTLHAVLSEAGFDVKSVFFKSLNINSTAQYPSEEEIAVFVRLIKKLDPAIVGISFRSTFFQLASQVTKEIKKNLDTLVVWGGIHPTIKPEQCIELSDIVCVGEGEGAIVDLATKVVHGEELGCIPNLWIKKDNEIIKGDIRPLIVDLDDLPFPDFLIKDKYFVGGATVLPLAPEERRTDYSIMTSRGCPFSCTYCYNNIAKVINKGKGKYVRRRSASNVIAELIQAKKKFNSLAYVTFLDDLFTFDLQWIKDFHGQYKKHINLPFYCHIHPKFTDEEMIVLLKDAGCLGMTMGLQTGSEESRHKYFERLETNEHVLLAAKTLQKSQIKTTYDLIMDNPLENDKNKRETFELLLELPKPFDLCIHSLTHFPGTKLTNLLLEKGMISEDDVEDKKGKSYERWVPSLDLDRQKEDLFWDNLYYLTQKDYISKKFLFWLSNRSILKMYPKILTYCLRLTSFSIYTIRSDSKLDTLRWGILTLINKPYLPFKKRTWFFLWAKIKQRFPSVFNIKE